MKTITITNESQTIKIGTVVLTAYLSEGKTVINVFPEKPMTIEPVSSRAVTIKVPIQ